MCLDRSVLLRNQKKGANSESEFRQSFETNLSRNDLWLKLLVYFLGSSQTSLALSPFYFSELGIQDTSYAFWYQLLLYKSVL